MISFYYSLQHKLCIILSLLDLVLVEDTINGRFIADLTLCNQAVNSKKFNFSLLQELNL